MEPAVFWLSCDAVECYSLNSADDLMMLICKCKCLVQLQIIGSMFDEAAMAVCGEAATCLC